MIFEVEHPNEQKPLEELEDGTRLNADGEALKASYAAATGASDLCAAW